ncbi:MAG TPA: hypothetical protein VGA37_05170 [Gemmatimonadales bacterium]
MRSDSDPAPGADLEPGTATGPAPAERTRFVEHRGERILLIDLSHLKEPHDESLEAIGHASELIQSQARQSLLTLTYVEGAQFNFEVAQAMWQFARRNRPYVIAGAVVGIAPGLQQELYHLVTRISRRKLPAFDDLDRAKDWLVSQKLSQDGMSGADA